MPCRNSLQLCPTFQDLMDCSPLGFSVHGILQARRGQSCHALPQGIFPTQGSNWHLTSLAVAGRFFISALGSPRFATPTNKILLIIPQVKLIRKKNIIVAITVGCYHTISLLLPSENRNICNSTAWSHSRTRVNGN